MSPFWILMQLRMMEMVVVITGALKTCKAPVKLPPPTSDVNKAKFLRPRPK